MPPITDHPLRYELANELHARPFPALTASGRAVFLAIKRPEEAASRDRQADLDHLAQLLHRHGADQPQPGATHPTSRTGSLWRTRAVSAMVLGQRRWARELAAKPRTTDTPAPSSAAAWRP